MDKEQLEFTIARLQMQPGDVLVVRAVRPIPSATAERIRDHVRAALPLAVQVLVIDSDVELSVLTPPPEAGA